MQVLRLLPDTVLTLLCQTTLDTSLTWPLITWLRCWSVCGIERPCTQRIMPSGIEGRRGYSMEHDASGWESERGKTDGHTAGQMSPLTGKAGPSGLLPPWPHGVFGVILLLGLAIELGAIRRGLAATGLVVAAVVHHSLVVVVFWLLMRLVVVVLVFTFRHKT